MSIPGGEPLIHPEMPQIVAGIVARKKFVYLCTNALVLDDRVFGVIGGYIRWSGMVDEPTAATQITERIAGRALDPFAREIIMRAHELR